MPRLHLREEVRHLAFVAYSRASANGRPQGRVAGSGEGVGGLIEHVDYRDQGYGELELGPDGALEWRYLVSANRSVVDRVTIPSRRRRRRE